MRRLLAVVSGALILAMPAAAARGETIRLALDPLEVRSANSQASFGARQRVRVAVHIAGKEAELVALTPMVYVAARATAAVMVLSAPRRAPLIVLAANAGGRRITVEVVLRWAWARGGGDEWWNLAAACSRCNLRKHARVPEWATSWQRARATETAAWADAHLEREVA